MPRPTAVTCYASVYGGLGKKFPHFPREGEPRIPRSGTLGTHSAFLCRRPGWLLTRPVVVQRQVPVVLFLALVVDTGGVAYFLLFFAGGASTRAVFPWFLSGPHGWYGPEGHACSVLVYW